MVNEYFENLNKIEFVVTYACTGRCKHCSEGDHKNADVCIDSHIAANTVKRVTSEYSIETVMTFGGEPLLYADTVFEIMQSAYESNVPHRQIITNGFFTKDSDIIARVATRLAECGVNDLLISVDAFHQETIPLEIVKKFAHEATRNKIPVKLQPAWLISPYHDNLYNRKTHELLKQFNLEQNEGNIIFPEGNAKKYLAEYFASDIAVNPYVEDPKNLRCLSVAPNGDVLQGNIYRQDILEIITSYKP